MSVEANNELVRRYFEAGGRDDLGAWDSLCAPDMQLLAGFGEPVRGLEAVKGFTAGFHAAQADILGAMGQLGVLPG
jgi:ketosteroid isomerase-like protein